LGSGHAEQRFGILPVSTRLRDIDIVAPSPFHDPARATPVVFIPDALAAFDDQVSATTRALRAISGGSGRCAPAVAVLSSVPCSVGRLKRTLTGARHWALSYQPACVHSLRICAV
jgi:hypothetical protein